ncbi:MAG: glutamyl-tRNA reductase, partial [Actinobacteria bacterium]|nr:glutamyl-tRNA reductase [Actinomycetota bacterium]
MRLVLVGISHHRAPVELRELVALAPAQAAELAAELAEDGEAVCLSTCNRTELYVAGQDGGAAETRALEALVRLSGAPEAKLTPFLYRLSDDEAALHLFRVAAGLDSMVPGEGEILGQVRAAYEAGAAGQLLDRAFRQALHAGRKARSETGIGESAASVSSVAAALAEQVFDDIRGRRVLLIGAGKTGESTARNFVSRGAAVSVVANRTPERAQELADRFGGQPVALRDVARELERADVVVSSTSSRGFV